MTTDKLQTALHAQPFRIERGGDGGGPMNDAAPLDDPLEESWAHLARRCVLSRLEAGHGHDQIRGELGALMVGAIERGHFDPNAVERYTAVARRAIDEELAKHHLP